MISRLTSVAATLLMGCYAYQPVKPTELPKLQDEVVEVVSLQQPNSKLVNVRPGSRIRLRRLQYPAYEVILQRPYLVEVDEDVLRYRAPRRSGAEPVDVIATDVGRVDWLRTGLIAGPIIMTLLAVTWAEHFRHGNDCSYYWWRCPQYEPGIIF